MRTTLDIDDALLAEAQCRFPPGTPKTVIFEEALRRLIAMRIDAPRMGREPGDPRMERLVAEGRVLPASSTAPPPSLGSVPLRRLLDDLALDREDRTRP